MCRGVIDRTCEEIGVIIVMRWIVGQAGWVKECGQTFMIRGYFQQASFIPFRVHILAQVACTSYQKVHQV